MNVVGSVLDTFRPSAVVDRGSFSGGYPFDVGLEGELLMQTLLGSRAEVAPNFLGFVQRALKDNPVVFGLILNRMSLFAEATFQFREQRGGRPGDIFGDTSLKILEHPWPGGTTATLLSLAELTNSCAGNFFARRSGDRLSIMRPDWTAIVAGSDSDETVGPLDLDAEVIGYLYQDGGPGSGRDPLFVPRNQVAHYMPVPDPEVPFRGMSWLTPVINELCADKEMTAHKRAYLAGGATPNLAMVLDPAKLNIKNPADFDAWVSKFEELRGRRSGGNPYKMLFLIGGADPVPLGANLDQIDFAKVQSAGEVRMAQAAMVHPSVAGLEAGLQGSALNAGNFDAAYRQFANGTIRPLWRKVAGALETICPPPRENARLWADDRDVPALAEDSKKLAEIAASDAETIAKLIMAGFKPDAVIDAVDAKDLARLKGQHTGLPSVQLQPGNTNGNGNGKPAPAPAAAP